MDNAVRYKQLYAAVCKYMVQNSKQEQQKETNRLWDQIKREIKSFDSVMADIASKSLQKKSHLISFWGRVTTKSQSSIEEEPAAVEVTAEQAKLNNQQPSTSKDSEEDGCQKATGDNPAPAAEAPKQKSLTIDISQLQEKLIALIRIRDAGLMTDDLKKKMEDIEKDLKTKKSILKRLEEEAVRQRKRRAEMKRTLQEITEDVPDLAPKLKKFTRNKVGKPAITEDQPDLLDAIITIASIGAAASDRRRSEELRSCKSLDDLQKALVAQGFNLSRSATYLRLLPRKASSLEGKRHIKTVPVKLIRAQNTAHDRHQDTAFAFASMAYLDEICAMFGPGSCFFLSLDDKAKIPLGLAAATKQAPILMHLEYKVRLPDHDFAVAARHKLIPSVYAACIINPEKFTDAVSYSGPTYVAIRSMKHDSSTAFTHGRDLERLKSVDNFKPFMCTSDGQVKPIFIVASDGGPDENPRFPKTLQVAVARFIEWNLDVYLTGTNAPHYSAYNRVERRMAPLSRELAGLVLPHDHFGSHLDASGKTTDCEREKQNFAKAGTTLAEIWSQLVIDGQDVFAEYINPAESCVKPDEPNAKWVANHVRQSQYFMQIIKCNIPGCCRPWRSSWNAIFPQRFLPGPVVLSHAEEGLCFPETTEVPAIAKTYFASLAQRIAFASSKVPMDSPFDMYCPSVSIAELQMRTCPQCKIYHASQASLKRHRQVHINDQNTVAPPATEVDSDDVMPLSSEAMTKSVDEKQDESMPVIRNLFEWLQTSFGTD